jgi:hypothetical protein
MNEVYDGAVGTPGLRHKPFPKVSFALLALLALLAHKLYLNILYLYAYILVSAVSVYGVP